MPSCFPGHDHFFEASVSDPKCPLCDDGVSPSHASDLCYHPTMREDFDAIAGELRRFAGERDWEQFHSPKNLAMAMTVEAAELLEHFQWLTEEQSKNLPPEKLGKIAEEIADIQAYLIRLADKLGIDIIESVRKKIKVNEAKYPADKVRGSSKKYDEYES